MMSEVIVQGAFIYYQMGGWQIWCQDVVKNTLTPLKARKKNPLTPPNNKNVNTPLP